MRTEAAELGTQKHLTSRAVPASFADDYPDLYVAAFRAAYRLLGSRSEAEDVAQEACARAFARWPQLVRRESATPWVVRVASNLAIDSWRRRQRREHGAPAVESVTTPGDDRRIDLHRALDTLPRRQRDVVVLRYVVDLSEADTATALGCAPGTVKSHANRGLAALRQALGEETA